MDSYVLFIHVYPYEKPIVFCIINDAYGILDCPDILFSFVTRRDTHMGFYGKYILFFITLKSLSIV